MILKREKVLILKIKNLNRLFNVDYYLGYCTKLRQFYANSIYKTLKFSTLKIFSLNYD